MKTPLILLLVVLTWVPCMAQLRINIVIDKEKNVTIGILKNGHPVDSTTMVSLSESGNVFSIQNQTHDTNFQVILLPGTGNNNLFRNIMLNPCNIPDSGIIEMKFGAGEQFIWMNARTRTQINFPSVLTLPCRILVKVKSGRTYKKSVSVPVLAGKGALKIPGDRKTTISLIPLYDALLLARQGENDLTPSELLEILNYYNNNTNETCLDTLMNQMKDNKFLYDFLKNKLDKYRIHGEKEGDKKFDFSKTLSSVGGLDVTTIADGFAKFIVKRTKQELSIAFFDKFNDELGKYPDLKTLFPQTCRSFSIIGNEIYQFEAYIQVLRENFENDLNTLPANLPGIIDNHPAFFSEFPELAATLKSGCYISEKLRDRVHPGEILAGFPAEYLDAFNPDLKSALHTLQLISASLRGNTGSGENYWADAKEIKELLKNETAFKIYLGLVYQEAKFRFHGISFQGTDLYKILNKTYDQWSDLYPVYRNYYNDLTERIQKITGMIRSYRQTANDSLAVEQYAGYFTASIDFLEFCTEADRLVPKGILNPEAEKKLRALKDSSGDYFEVARTSARLVLDVNRRNYAAAVTNAVHIYDLVYSKQWGKVHSPKENIMDTSATVMKKIFRYGSFMATLVQAGTSDEVTAAIESFALPTGSSRIKRETVFNVALNAYCGLFSGFERIKGIDAPWTWNYQKINSFGVTAPVGITISRGHSVFFAGTGRKGWTKERRGWAGWSTSAFISLVDLGALASFRFTDDSTKNAPTVLLQDIISPGIFLSLGIPKTPLSVNLGWQIGPLLRGVTAKTTEYKNSYTRISISVCADIPILNFYSIPKNH